MPHIAKPAVTSTSRSGAIDYNPANPPSAQACAHHFLDPVVWMKDELEKGLLSGKLECQSVHQRLEVMHGRE